MYILTDCNNVIHAIGDNATDDNGVIFINGAGYALYNQKLYTVDTIPTEVSTLTHLFDGSVFTINPHYENPNKLVRRLDDAEQQLTDLQIAITELYEEMISGE